MERLIRNEKAVKLVEEVQATKEIAEAMVTTHIDQESNTVELRVLVLDKYDDALLDQLVASAAYTTEEEANKELAKAQKMAATLDPKIQEVVANDLVLTIDLDEKEVVVEEEATETKEDTAEIVYGDREVAIIQDAKNKSEAIRQLYDIDFTVREIFHILNNVGLKTRYQMVYQVIERYEGKLELEGMSEEA